MSTSRAWATILVVIVPLCAPAQKGKKQFPKPSLKGQLVLPLRAGNDLFAEITETIGEVDLGVQLPLFKGLGIGAGGSGTFFTLDERALASAAHGDVTRWMYYGKLQYEHYADDRSFFELSAKVGTSIYRWNASTCPEPRVDRTFHWGTSLTYYLGASENLAFGILIGYEVDDIGIEPATVCLEEFAGRTVTEPEAPLGFLTLGLCFHTRFARSEEEGWEGGF
jgi:hypothetical protein